MFEINERDGSTSFINKNSIVCIDIFSLFETKIINFNLGQSSKVFKFDNDDERFEHYRHKILDFIINKNKND